MYDVIIHYLTTDLQNRTLFIDLKRVQDVHSGENIVETIVRIIQEYDIVNKVNYFQVDNIENNDICIKAILKEILLSSIANQRRLRYYGHVINFVVKAFLFDNDPDAFELEINTLKKLKLEIRHERELLTL